MPGDTMRMIQKCLSCSAIECTNCLAEPSGNGKQSPGRPAQAIEARNGSERKYFDSVNEAAKFACVCSQSIRNAIKDGVQRYGYWWRYAE